MKKELFQTIMEKIAKDYGAARVLLYNWGEPFLHPQLPEMIELVVKNGCECYLSSNLNVMPNIEAVLSAKPASLRISCSGFRQEIYGLTHRNGNIEKVKANMRLLSAALRKTGAPTLVHVAYHRYRHNLDDEYSMKRFANSLGFGFNAVWALLEPGEKVLAYAEPQAEKQAITPADRELIALLALPLDLAIKYARRYHAVPCGYPAGQISMNAEGNVRLCCTVYDQTRFMVGNFLSQSHAEIQAKKNTHPFCNLCMKHGIHKYMITGAYEFYRLGISNIPLRHALRLTLYPEQLAKILFRWLMPAKYLGWWYDRYLRLLSMLNKR